MTRMRIDVRRVSRARYRLTPEMIGYDPAKASDAIDRGIWNSLPIAERRARAYDNLITLACRLTSSI